MWLTLFLEIQTDVNGSLFLGNLVFILSTSPSFATDLLLADSVPASTLFSLLDT
jgi:hypothetical protein